MNKKIIRDISGIIELLFTILIIITIVFWFFGGFIGLITREPGSCDSTRQILDTWLGLGYKFTCYK